MQGSGFFLEGQQLQQRESLALSELLPALRLTPRCGLCAPLELSMQAGDALLQRRRLGDVEWG